MFYSPFAGNDKSIAEAAKLIEQHRDLIREGKAWIVIRGFCGSYSSRTENLRAAKNRSNQVKSYFITNYWMKEKYYKTRNHVDTYRGNKEIVAVVGIEYLPGYEPKQEKAPQAELPEFEPLTRETGIPVAGLPSDMMPERMASLPEPEVIPVQETEASRPFHLPLIFKSNLIYDAMLAPSLEIEYVIDDHWSAAVETSIAWWHNSHKHWYYQIATLIPEVRYRINARKPGHYHTVGLFGGAGWYDLEYKKTGYKGELWMAGASYSYTIPINRLLGLEFGAGLGFMSAKHEEYLPIDGHYVYQQTSRTSFFGPLRLKCALLFDVNRFMKKGGAR